MEMLKKIDQKFFGILLWPLKKYWALWGKKKWLFILITLLVLGGLYFSYTKIFKSSGGTDDLTKLNYPPAEEITLTTGDIVSSVKMVGTSKLENEQTLKFTNAGKIVGVYVKVGMRVKEGQLLASLDMSEVESKIQKAKNAYEKAKRNIKDLLDGKDKTEILSAKYAVKRAEISLEKTKDELRHSKEIKKFELAKVHADLKMKKKEYLIEKEKNKLNAKVYKETLLDGEDKVKFDNAEKDYIQKFENTLREIENKYYSLKDSLDEMDKYIGIKKELEGKYLDASLYFSAQNPKYKAKAREYMNKCYAGLEILKKEIDVIKNNYRNSKNTQNNIGKNQYNVIHNIKLFIPLNKELKRYYNNLYHAGENYAFAAKNSVEGGSFSASLIMNLESMGKTAQNTGNSGIDDTQKKIETLKSEASFETLSSQKKIGYLDKIKEYEEKKTAFTKLEVDYKNTLFDLEQKEKNLLRNIEEKTLAVKESENALEKAKEDYKKIKKGYTEDELQNAKDSLESQKKELEAAEKEREKYHITATFDGTIRKVYMQVGDSLTENDQQSIILENRDMIKIEMKADQSDILKLKLGQNTTIKFDAFPGKQFKGKIIEIDETPQKTEGVVKYKVVVSLTDLQGAKIFSDMSAMVDVLVSEKVGINVVPVTAVGNDKKGSYVLKFDDNSKIYVTVGAQDGKNIEIVSGLDMNTKIKSSTFNSKSLSEMGLSKTKDEKKKKDDVGDIGDMEMMGGEYAGGF